MYENGNITEEREMILLPTNQHKQDSLVWHVEGFEQLQTICFDERGGNPICGKPRKPWARFEKLEGIVKAAKCPSQLGQVDRREVPQRRNHEG